MPIREGRRRNPNNWNDYNITPDPLFTKGFTGHEHIDELGLINMNGRVYDPRLGRFLSPDPYIQAPDFTQSFNRYAYCWNNPLKYTDPDGEWVFLAVAAFFGGTANVISNIDNIEDGWDVAKYFGVGAFAGALGAGVGAGVSVAFSGAGTFWAGFVGSTTNVGAGFATGFASGAAAGFAGGFTGGLGNELLAGEDFGDALLSGLKAGGWGALGGGITGGIMGGIDARMNDQCFWTGSPHKEYYVTDGKALINTEDYYRSKNQKTKEKFMLTFSETNNEPIHLKVKTPKGFEATGYKLRLDTDVIYSTPQLTKSGRNYATYKMTAGSDFGFGSVVMRRTQVLDHSSIFRIQLFHTMDRSKSFIWGW